MNLRDLIGQMEELGYSDEDASARVCQDIVLKAISNSRFSRNVTSFQRKWHSLALKSIV